MTLFIIIKKCHKKKIKALIGYIAIVDLDNKLLLPRIKPWVSIVPLNLWTYEYFIKIITNT